MPETMNTREKVSEIIDANKYEAWTVDRAGQMADAILAALASGSGDHAELALNAKAAQTWALGIYENREQAARRSTFIDSDLPATVLALLAENAALRAERDGHFGMANRSEDAWLKAERKLAEADQVIRDIAETPYTGADWPRSRAATYLASKEAERG